MELSSQTQWLAIWGAATGTIGTIAGVLNLWLRYRHHARDKAALQCKAVFDFEHSSGTATPKHRVLLRSVGRRPIAVDVIRFFIQPRTVVQKLLRAWHWRKGRWVWNQEFRHQTEIPEGQKREEPIRLPDGLDYCDIRKVQVVDQTGRAWPVDWPSKRGLARQVFSKKVFDVEEKNSIRECRVVGYQAGENLYIYAQWNTQPESFSSSAGRFWSFRSAREFEAKRRKVLDEQMPAILRNEADGVV